MYSKIKHDKKVINQFKFKRVLNNPDAIMCNVYLTLNGDTLTGSGVLLNNKVYIALQTGYYSYTINEMGANKDNLAFQPLYLVTPF